MACKLLRNKEGQIIGITAANGERSLLFDSLSKEKKLGTGRAYEIHTALRTNKKFIDWFGAKWDTREQTGLRFDPILGKKLKSKLQKLYPEIRLNITNTPNWEQGNDILNQSILNPNSLLQSQLLNNLKKASETFSALKDKDKVLITSTADVLISKDPLKYLNVSKEGIVYLDVPVLSKDVRKELGDSIIPKEALEEAERWSKEINDPTEAEKKFEKHKQELKTQKRYYKNLLTKLKSLDNKSEEQLFEILVNTSTEFANRELVRQSFSLKGETGNTFEYQYVNGKLKEVFIKKITKIKGGIQTNYERFEDVDLTIDSNIDLQKFKKDKARIKKAINKLVVERVEYQLQFTESRLNDANFKSDFIRDEIDYRYEMLQMNEEDFLQFGLEKLLQNNLYRNGIINDRNHLTKPFGVSADDLLKRTQSENYNLLVKKRRRINNILSNKEDYNNDYDNYEVDGDVLAPIPGWFLNAVSVAQTGKYFDEHTGFSAGLVKGIIHLSAQEEYDALYDNGITPRFQQIADTVDINSLIVNKINFASSVDLSNDMSILNQKDKNRIIGQANIKAGKVLIDALNQKQDTLPHEYAHHYIAWFRDTPLVKEAIKKWGSEEALVQSIGEQVVKQKGDAYNWWNKFVDWILKKFNNLSSLKKEQLTEILTDAFLTRQDLSKGNLSKISQPTQQASSQSSIFTDKNGEPKIISGSGRFEVMNLKGEIRPLSDFIKGSQGMDPILEIELLDIAADVVVDSSRNARNVTKNIKEARILLNPTIVNKKLVDNGVLSKIILTEAFPSMGRSPLSQKTALGIYRVYQANGFEKAVEAAKEQGHILPPAGRLFFKMYDNWNDELDKDGNVASVGYRNKIKERLKQHNIKWKRGSTPLDIEEDTPIRIYGISRLQENPRDKLSANVKAALVGIKYVNEDSYLKANVSMTVDKVYGILVEGVVDSRNYSEMIAKLEYLSKYRPDVLPVLKRLQEATTQEQAAIFSNFSLVYSEFLMLQIYKVETEQGTETVTNMFNPNEGSIARRYRTLYNENSVERESPNPRAFYREDKEGNLKPIPEKVKTAEEAFARMEKAMKSSPGNTVSKEVTDALGEYLWTLGMQYGPTLLTTQESLASLFREGYYVNNRQLTGKALLKQYLQPVLGEKGSKNLKYLLYRATNLRDNNIYTEETSMVRHIASFAPLFDAQQVGSFISGTNKQYWPVNLGTLLDETVLTLRSQEGAAYIEKVLEDPFYNPPGTYTNKSPFLSELGNNTNYRHNHFKVETLDSVKEPTKTNDYDSQSDRVSLLMRLNAYANNDNKNFTKIAVPTEADRGVLHFLTHPRYDKLNNFTKENIIKGFLVQDLIRKAQAETQVQQAEKDQDPSKLIEGYHFIIPTEKEMETMSEQEIADIPYQRNGNAFTLKMSQIEGQVDSEIEEDKDGYLLASNLIKEYLDKNLSTNQMKLMDEYFDREIEKVNEMLKKSEEDVKSKIKDTKISLSQEVFSKQSTKPDFIENFVFNDLVGRIETVKLLRGGYTFAKNKADFYKRMALLTTPGYKLFIKNKNASDPDYGMPPTYKELIIADFDFEDIDLANEVADGIQKRLEVSGLLEAAAAEEADKYRPGKGIEKTDGQGFISVHMYRSIQMGLGTWEILDEEAYQNEIDRDPKNPFAGKFVTNRGKYRILKPTKPYHEQLDGTNIKNLRTLTMNKNSYLPVSKELADEFPILKKMHDAFEKGIDVINPRSAAKGVKIGTQDLLQVESLDVSNALTMDSTKLRFPQIIPTKKKGKIVFSRQVRKNSIAGIQMDAVYENGMTGREIFEIYSNSIAENIKEDTAILERELKITTLRSTPRETKEFADAKHAYLTEVRKRLIDQIEDKELPNNYIKALDIVPDGPYNWRFKAPLSFPSYQAKFEQIFLSVFKNGIFNQYIKGKELVQIAEAGGHGVDSELRMYDGTNRAQVRIKASVLGLPAGTKIEDVDPILLQAIGYRVPHQGKNSSLPIQVVGFLPDSHEKAIMVPGAITRQQGSDFDVDKMYIIQPETEVVDGKLQRVDPAYKEKNPTRKQRDARIYDMLDTILTSIHHFQEVISPLDNPVLEDLAAELRTTSIDYSYNHPLVEISMERRNKTGQRQTGVWANFIAGHNVLSVHPLAMTIPFTINGKTFKTVGELKDANENFVEHNKSYYLSAAVDASTKPIHVDINDNYMTAPVSGMMLSAGAAVEDVVYFVSQPIIKEVVETAQNEEIGITRAIRKVAFKYNGRKIGETLFEMTSKDLKDDAMQSMKDVTTTDSDIMGGLSSGPKIKRQLEYLSNFAALLPQGQHLQQLNKLLTPDTLENVNEISSLVAYNDNLEDFLSNPEILIIGAQQFFEQNIYPISTAYDTVRQTSLNAAEEAGFINNRPAFYGFKERLKLSIGKTTLSAAQHKFIDRALFLKIMASPESPLRSLMSQDAFNIMYTNPNNHIGIRLENIKKEFPKLSRNAFVEKLKPSKQNNDLNQTIFTIDFDTSYDMTSADKNRFSNALLSIVKNPSKYANNPTDASEIEQIVNFGKMLVSNQLLSSGFAPGPGAYIDLVPIEFFETRLLTANQSPLTPIEFFEQEQKHTNFENYFEGFQLDFIRNFGTASPGGYPLLKLHRLPKDQRSSSRVEIQNKDITTAGIVPQYFVTYLPSGPKIFVLADSGDKYSTYKELQLSGMRYRVHEVLSDRTNAPSLVSQKSGNNYTERPGVVHNPATGATDEAIKKLEDRLNNLPESVEEPIKICKI